MQQAVHLYVQMPILQRKMLVGKNPKPFQICTLLVQARKETYSYQMIVKTMKYLLIHTKDAGMIIFTLLKKSGRISLVSV